MLTILTVLAVLPCLCLGHQYENLVDGVRAFHTAPRVANQAPHRKCNQELAGKCGLEYCETFGVNCTLDPHSSVAQADAIIQKKRLAGFQEMCGALENYVHCLGGPEETAACQTIEQYEAWGANATDATAMAYLSKIGDLGCTKYKRTFEDNWPCIWDVGTEHHATEEKCMAEFAKAQEEKPSCDNFQKYIVECWYKEGLGKYCGRSVGIDMCNRMKDTLHDFVGDCKIDCPRK